MARGASVGDRGDRGDGLARILPSVGSCEPRVLAIQGDARCTRVRRNLKNRSSADGGTAIVRGSQVRAAGAMVAGPDMPGVRRSRPDSYRRDPKRSVATRGFWPSSLLSRPRTRAKPVHSAGAIDRAAPMRISGACEHPVRTVLISGYRTS